MLFHVPRSRHDIQVGWTWVDYVPIVQTCPFKAERSASALCSFHQCVHCAVPPASSRLLFVETLGNGYCLQDLRWGRRWSPRRLHSLLNPQSPSSVVVGVCTTTVIHFGIKRCQQFRNRYGPTNGYCSYCSRQCYRHAARDKQQLAVKSLFSHSSPPFHLPTFRSTVCSLAVNSLPLSVSLLSHSAIFSSLTPCVLCKCQTKRNRENLPLDTETAP